jgi:hypothetical protein
MATCLDCNSSFNEEDIGLHVCHAQSLPPAGTEVRTRYTATHKIEEQIRYSDQVVLRIITTPIDE